MTVPKAKVSYAKSYPGCAVTAADEQQGQAVIDNRYRTAFQNDYQRMRQGQRCDPIIYGPVCP